MAAADDLKGRVALVTGASSGLGRRFAQVLAEAGAAVAVTARRTDRLPARAGGTGAAGGRGRAVEWGVRDVGSVHAALTRVEASLGPRDVLVNNAGITVQKPAEAFTEEDYEAVLGTNLKGAWLCAQE